MTPFSLSYSLLFFNVCGCVCVFACLYCTLPRVVPLRPPLRPTDRPTSLATASSIDVVPFCDQSSAAEHVQEPRGN